MSECDNLGLRYGQTKDFEELVIHNAWPADVFGRALCFSDLGILEIASIEKHVQPYGAVLVLGEEEAATLKFGYSESFTKEPTPGQQTTLQSLAALKSKEIPKRLRKRAEGELPALFIAEFAVVANAIYFREDRRKQKYESVLAHWSETIRAAEDQAHRDFTVDVRSHLQGQDFDTSGLPRSRLDDQHREAMRNDIDREINELYAKAQLLPRVELSTPEFAIIAAQHAVSALS